MFRPRPTLEFRHGDRLGADVFASKDAIWFQGHFPQTPLLPGVAMLAMVEEAIERFWSDTHRAAVRVAAYRRVRFRQRVRPEASLHIQVQEAGPGRLRFSVEVAGQLACSGECTVSDGAATSAEQPFEEAALSAPPWPSDQARFASDGTPVGVVLARARALGGLASAAGKPRICVATEDRVDVAAALLAAFAGEAQVIFPPALSPEVVRATLQATPASHWLGPEDWLPLLGDGPARRIESEQLPDDGRALAVGDERLPCVLLPTGGTTGQPRLWQKSRRNLLREVMAHIHALQVGPDDHILATVPPHHIYGLLFSVLLPIYSGATVERVSPFFPHEIALRIASSSATILISAPAHLRALSASLDSGHALRLVLSSGAPLSAVDAAAFAAHTKRWPLEVYGSTETGGIAYRRQEQPDAPWQPLPGVACRTSASCLAVRSDYLSVDAELDDDGFFVTADRVDLRPDASFDLLGRSDGIVKVGGQRVSLPEIEKALLSLSGVEDAAALALPVDSGRGQEIVTLVVSQRSAADLVRELRVRLPSPCWPRRLRTVAEIPTTPSGKRDRGAIVQLFQPFESTLPEEPGA